METLARLKAYVREIRELESAAALAQWDQRPTCPRGAWRRGWRVACQVWPSLIWVEADEVTYNLHIALRFELEIELIAGRLFVEELPDRWNEAMEGYLGIVSPDDAKGVLQECTGLGTYSSRPAPAESAWCFKTAPSDLT